MLLDVLCGIETEKIVKSHLNTCTTFGVYYDFQRDKLHAIIEWMIVNHFVLRTKERYPTLHLTSDGIHYDESMTLQKLRNLKKYIEEEVILWNE